MQDGLERTFGGLYQACLNSTEGPEGLLRVVREEARAYLDARLGEVDLAAMFGPVRQSGDQRAELARSFEAAAPALVGGGPWAQDAVAVLAGRRRAGCGSWPPTAAPPDGRRRSPPGRGAAVPGVPARCRWRRCRSSARRGRPPTAPPPDTQQATPHARTDVTRGPTWTRVTQWEMGRQDRDQVQDGVGDRSVGLSLLLSPDHCPLSTVQT